MILVSFYAFLISFLFLMLPFFFFFPDNESQNEIPVAATGISPPHSFA